MTPIDSGRRKRALGICLCFAIGVSLAGEPAPGRDALTPPKETEPGTSFSEPRANSGLAAPVSRKLTNGFRIAIELVRQHPSCRALFTELESDPVKMLQYSIYVPARRGLEQGICERGVVAYTEVGSAVTRLCSDFARLGDRRAAWTLIHEALHHAGLGEKPLHADGLTSDQITRRVARQCG